MLTSLVGTSGSQAGTDFAITSDSRWVTFRAAAGPANIDPLMGPGNVFTVAFYTQAHAGVCQPRKYQMNFVSAPGLATIANEAIVQNQVTFDPVFANYIQFSSLLFPYDYTEAPPGYSGTLGTTIDTYQPTGLKPSWECNM